MLLSICPGPANLWPALLLRALSFYILSTLAAAREINRQRPVPVILLTGRRDVESLAWAAGCAVVKFLIKPVKENDLQAAREAVVSPTVPDTQEPPSSR